MGPERIPNPFPKPDEAQIFLEHEIQTVPDTREKTPLAILGELVIGAAIGGALSGSTVMPRAEAVTLELVVGTTRVADEQQERP